MTTLTAAPRQLGVFVTGLLLAESAFYSVVPPLIPGLVREAHMTTTEVGVLVAAYPAGIVVAAVPSLMLANMRGLRIMCIAGLSLLVIATLGFAWSTAALVLDVARLIQGIGGGIVWAGALAWLTSTSPASRRGSVIGRAVGAALIGTVLGAPIGALASQVGRGFVFSAIAVVLAVMAMMTPLPAAASARRRNSLRSVARLLQNPRAVLGNGFLVTIGVITGTVASLVPLLVGRRHGSPAAIAIIFVASYLLASCWNMVFGRLADRVGSLIPVIAGFAIAAALLPWLPAIDSLVVLAIATVIASSAVSGLWTPIVAMVTDGAPGEAFGQAASVASMNASWAIGAAFGAIAVSGIADIAGFPASFTLVGGICAVAALICVASRWRGSLGHIGGQAGSRLN